MLRTRAQPKEPPMSDAAPTFSGTELERYARHIVLRELGGPGQKRLKQAKVLVIGAGGLGAPALQYLAAAGVGTIGVIDDDIVENANLQRQVIHRDKDIGTPKVFSAQAAMEAQNPYVIVRPYHRRLDAEIATELFSEYDLILDGTDNFDTRYLVNRTAVALGKPLISGALSQWEGQLSLFHPKQGGPCYQCIFPEAPAMGLAPSCSEAGVIGPLPGVVGSMMAVEAIKHITGAGMVLRDELLIYDALYGESRKIRLSRNEECPICNAT
ncbi:molybdopterin biosynthesis protein MoeB, putative [Roseobacter sp. SK209-2-6]|nr:molybdopterin biosynthesis protein MoeB, putative [Roseobacter sp. SK209-2-6]